MTEALELLIEERFVDSIDGAVLEYEDIYTLSDPYTMIPTLEGNCYAWENDFIEGILLAMATDRLSQFSTTELEAWRYFVNFQNYHTHSPLDSDANGTAVGCTIPDSLNRSYVVAEDGTITTTRCQEPSYGVPNEDVWASLDRAMMSLYNCEEIDDCNANDTMEQTVPCVI